MLVPVGLFATWALISVADFTAISAAARAARKRGDR